MCHYYERKNILIGNSEVNDVKSVGNAGEQRSYCDQIDFLNTLTQQQLIPESKTTGELNDREHLFELSFIQKVLWFYIFQIPCSKNYYKQQSVVIAVIVYFLMSIFYVFFIYKYNLVIISPLVYLFVQ